MASDEALRQVLLTATLEKEEYTKKAEENYAAAVKDIKVTFDIPLELLILECSTIAYVRLCPGPALQVSGGFFSIFHELRKS